MNPLAGGERGNKPNRLRRTIPAAMLAAALLLLPGMATAQEALTSQDVSRVVAQAANEAAARGRPANIVVVDRVGNVLAVYSMTGAPLTLRVSSNRGLAATGLEGLVIDQAPGAALAAGIAKAITGAYLSSSGNAFTTRTASQIVQENFNPGERFMPGGPLSGVQFSQLPCSDLSVRAASDSGGMISATLGPKRSPLGLSADPGGLPLYKNGQVVGGIGVEADGVYTLDRNIFDRDTADEELIAVAGSVGFDAPQQIRADRISVDGRTLRFTDRNRESLVANPTAAAALPVTGPRGGLVSVRGYYDSAAGFRAGTAYGSAASGYRLATAAEFGVPGAMILVDEQNLNRYPARDSTDGGLRADDVRVLLEEAYRVTVAARAQIRRPLNSFSQVTVSVVDTNGIVLGLVRTADAPVFGTDVSLQKARTAAFMSGGRAVGDLVMSGQSARLARFREFLGPTALTGNTAFSARAVGFLARPFYPDGINGNGPGPLANAFETWSPFANGLQLDLVLGNIVGHVFHVLAGTPDTPPRCTGLPVTFPHNPAGLVPPRTTDLNRLANGMQIFSGGVPIYRGGVLVGGIGASGDGVDQDDMVTFLGLHRAGERLGGAIGNAPAALRADRLTPAGARLRYVSCPFAPFLGSQEQNPCAGK